MRLLVAAGVVVLALTGCAPNTGEAYSRCVDANAELWKLEHPDHELDEFVDELVRLADMCSAAAEADPVKFNEVWG